MKAVRERQRRFRFLSRAAFLFPVALMSFACGLPNVPYLYPPTEFDVGNTSIKITSNVENYQASEGSDQSYLGMEIYYHVFDSATTANAKVAQIVSLSATYEKSPASFIKVIISASHRFQRLRNSTTNSAPLIPITNPAVASSFYVNPSRSTSWNMTDEDLVEISTIVRNISNRVLGDLDFKAMDFLSGDDDYTGASSPGTIYIVLFGISFGKDPESIGVALYSSPNIDQDIIEYSPAG